MPQTLNTNEPIYSSLGSDPDLADLVEMFVEEMPERLASFLTPFQQQNWQELRRAAHQIKGAAGSYGFPQISAMAAELEEAVSDPPQPEQLAELVERLVNLCNRARAGSPD